MSSPQSRQRSIGSEAGIALVAVLLLSVVALILTGALSTLMLNGAVGTSFAKSSESSYLLAQAGVNATKFRIEAATNPAAGPLSVEGYLAGVLGNAPLGTPRAGTRSFTGTLQTGGFAVTLTDPVAGDNMLTLTSVGTDTASGRTRTVTAILRGQPVQALNFAVFGNKISFHNHNKVAYGVTLNTSIFSNGSIQIDQGISIQGPTLAVNTIEPELGSGGVPNTVLDPAGQQGDPDPNTDVPTAPVVQAVPAPPVQAFPTFDFFQADETAAAAGRKLAPGQLLVLIANARTFAAALPATGVPVPLPLASYPGGVSAANVPVNVVHYQQGGGASVRPITIPNVSNADRAVPLGSPDGIATPAVNTHLYEIQFVGDPLNNTLLYVNGTLNLTQPTDTLVQIQGSLIVNGSVDLNAPTEILAWHNRTGPKFVPLGQTLYSPIAETVAQAAAGQPYDIIYSNWPAIAANGSVKLSNSGGGDGGPVHVEGAVYSVSETHFHKSNPYESSYMVGSQIADTIHNCQWFSFAYDPQARSTIGLYGKAAGRQELQIVRIEDGF